MRLSVYFCVYMSAYLSVGAVVCRPTSICLSIYLAEEGIDQGVRAMCIRFEYRLS